MSDDSQGTRPARRAAAAVTAFYARHLSGPLGDMLRTGREGVVELVGLAGRTQARLPRVLRHPVGRFAAILVLVLCAISILQPDGPGDLREVVAGELGQRRIEQLAPQLRAAAGEFGLDPYLVAGLVFTESSGRVDAVSSANALGLMQLKVSTAAERAQLLGVPAPTREQLLKDPLLNLRLGCAYLDYLMKRQEGSVDQALMAYNAGPTAFNSWIRDAGGFEAWMVEQQAKGEPKLGTVRHYAEKVQRVADTYRSEKLLR